MSDMGNLPVKPVPEALLRVGNAERHEAVTALGEHFATGRLDQQEFDERIQAAYGARTRVDLQQLFVDLPEPVPFRTGGGSRPATPPPRAPSRRRLPFVVPVFPLLLVAMIALSAATRVPVFPFFLLLFWFGWGSRAWRRQRGCSSGHRSW